MRQVTLAVTQFANGANNLETAESLVRSAAKAGAQIILLQELFETSYFCQIEDGRNLTAARTHGESAAVARFRSVAKELGTVLPVSFYERMNNAYYNSLAIIDADGGLLGVYRKSHIPDGAGYREKYYFNPGYTGFTVWDTAYARIGCGICWDQWFPEAARIFALRGAELLLYPTAIGSEPQNPELDSLPHWRTVMQGHAAANLTPVAASNRVGTEPAPDGSGEITFYGSSFIADAHGQIAAEMGRGSPGFAIAGFDLDELRVQRAAWGVFRDRRPDLYAPILTADGMVPSKSPL
jgi:N-carbamoylputrescine amidase